MTDSWPEIYERYSREHSHCPQCGHDEIQSTTVWYGATNYEDLRDLNRANCCTCSWVGEVHDLVDAAEARRLQSKPPALPVCPVCKQELRPVAYIGYYEDFFCWLCDCQTEKDHPTFKVMKGKCV